MKNRVGKINNDWSLLSTYRNEIFGLSIVGIIILHYVQILYNMRVGGSIGTLVKWYYYLIGSTGVEIFLFLSGMGLCFSMNKDSNVFRFYSRRFKRLLLPYAIWGGLFWIIKDMVFFKMGFGRVLYDFFFISFWREGTSSLWFVAFIILAYLLYPIIHWCFRKENKFRTGWFILSLVVCVLLVKWIKVNAPYFYVNTKLATYRGPIFLFGAYYGQKIFAKEKFNIGDKLLVLMGLIANGLFIANRYYPMSFMKYIDVEYIKCLYSISLVVLIALALGYIKKTVVNNALISIGSLSLELYMTHVNIRKIMLLIGYELDKIWMYAICIILSVYASIMISRICKAINNLSFARQRRLVTEKI